MANKKTTEHAAEVIKAIKAEYGDDIIKDFTPARGQVPGIYKRK